MENLIMKLAPLGEKLEPLAQKMDLGIVLYTMLAIFAITIISIEVDLHEIDKFLNRTKEKKKKEKSSSLLKFKESLYVFLTIKGKEKLLNKLFYSFLISLLVIFFLFLRVNNVILAVVIPLTIYSLSHKILKEFVLDINTVIGKDFSTLVNHMIKHFTKTNDLSIVLYESSKEISPTLRPLLLALSREIMVTNDEQRLIKFLEKTDSLWLHAFLLTLINYRESGKKESTIENLLRLASMVEKRTELTAKMASDRKPVVVINYMLLVAGVIILFGNCFLNPIMRDFVVTPLGTMSFIIGISCIFLTILLNIKLIKE